MKIPINLTSWAFVPIYKLWCKTLRYSESGREKIDAMNESRELMVFSLWHNEVFPVMFAKRNLRIAAVVSRSGDGEFIARLLEGLGMKTARGSSSRGGLAALKQMGSLMVEEKFNACLTIDGPRGPRHEPKDGAIFLAHHTKAAIVPMRIFMKKAKIFNSWDKFRLPLPFSRVHITFDTPYYITVEKDLTKEYLATACTDLKDRLAAIQPPEPGFLDD